MPAATPESVPVFTTLQNDQDYVLAEHQNNPNDEITAALTMTGVLGKPQSWGVDFISAFKNAKAPLCTKLSGSTISVSAGVVWIANSGQSIRLPRRNTVALTLTAANLDTGSLADDTMYYIWGVADTAATTFTCVISASASAPTGPSQYELIGWFFNEAAGALDITKGLVGNVKGNGRSVPNYAFLQSTTQVSTASTSAADDTEALLKIYTHGRPVLIEYNLGVGSATATAGIAAQISVDASDITATKRNVSAYGGATDRQGLTCKTIQLLAAGAHTIQGRFFNDTSLGVGTVNVNAREITAVEL